MSVFIHCNTYFSQTATHIFADGNTYFPRLQHMFSQTATHVFTDYNTYFHRLQHIFSQTATHIFSPTATHIFTDYSNCIPRTAATIFPHTYIVYTWICVDACKYMYLHICIYIYTQQLYSHWQTATTTVQTAATLFPEIEHSHRLFIL